MIHFNNSYDCKVDAKGRLMLPSGLKNQLLPLLKDGFIIKRSVNGKCLELWPKVEWDVEMGKLKKLNRYVKKNNDFIRIFMAGVKEIEIDNAGRLLIPKNLVSIAAIKKEISLSSAVNYIEIWDKERYEQEIEIEPLDFEAMAEEVMGGDGIGAENTPDVS
ncbi:division/cell wall cluster transcriptional repressor MraZ [Aurantibacter sp.]|uniref:division/cell wall cluster transcriptional repressor MraZ n=1 Tax=Aurantibacter sp. TaxID=2807103 RepID=UPI0032647C48